MAPRIPKRNARFIDSDAETDRGRAVLEMLRGLAGAQSQASVMRPGETEAYGRGEAAGLLGSIAEMIPGIGTSKMAMPALAGIFAGRKAFRADLPKSYLAEELLANGADPREVWSKTGWFKSPDGQMRFEIPDNDLEFVDIPSHQWQSSYQGPVFSEDDLLSVASHPDFEYAYPDIVEDYVLTMDKVPAGTKIPLRGAHSVPRKGNPGQLSVTAENERNARSTLAHELQHAVQRFEGFEPGGSSKAFTEESLRGAYNKYRSLMGEAEARAVQERLLMSPQERKKTFPLDSYDVPIESLIRKGKDYAEGGSVKTPRIPKRNARFIDSDAETDRGRAALEMLRGYAGAPSQASVMHPGALSAYEGGELAGMAEMLIPGASLAKGALGAALAGVIKPRGGNWIPGGVESSISNLLRREYTPASVDLQRTALEMARQRGYDDNMIAELARGLQQREAPIALNRWIEGPLTKYIKRDFATPEDPIRKLADEGILHMEIPQTRVRTPDYIAENRLEAGFPAEGLSTTPGGSMWENLSDRTISWGPAKYLQREPKMVAENPWMQKLDPESQVYEMRTFIERGTGFDHLVDELSNSLNPDSGLPRNLLLRPEQMQQMGMEKAVRHVDAINKWRAAQQAAANAELANKAMVVREYAENNPKGLRWVELAPEKEVDEATIQVGRDGGAKVDLPGEEVRYFNSPEEAKKHIIERRLEKQLKYEGDTMGHCVGGYCPDVLEGRSRIFSLRDAKGEPHVTVEVEPSTKSLSGELLNDIEPGIWDTIVKENGHSDLRGWLKTNRPDVWEKLQTPSIAQIKGKQNLAPKDEYLPFVQDFVRNSPLGAGWSRVGDLWNTNLRKVGDRYVTLDELKEMPKTRDGFPIGYEPLDDRPEWKDGGIVEFPKITPKAMLNRVISAYNSL